MNIVFCIFAINQMKRSPLPWDSSSMMIYPMDTFDDVFRIYVDVSIFLFFKFFYFLNSAIDFRVIFVKSNFLHEQTFLQYRGFHGFYCSSFYESEYSARYMKKNC